MARVSGNPSADAVEALVAAAYRSYARYWVDAFRAHRLDPREVMERSTGVGLEILDEVRDSGRGGIVATGHIGSWDMGAFFSTQRGWRLAVVAEMLEPRQLFDRFVRLRQDLGVEVIPLARGGRAVTRLEQIVHDGGIATLLADRDLGGKGPVVDFFGEPCRLPPGPAALARRTGRPVVPGAFFTTADGWRAVVHEPVHIAHLDVPEGTQELARALERLIAEAPEQWHVFVPNWLADREPGHPALGESGEPPGKAEPA
jgi:phosphatidylinositol dimannoside acyltransferase